MQEDLLYNSKEALYAPSSPALSKVNPLLSPDSDTFSVPSPPPTPPTEAVNQVRVVPDTEILIRSLGPNNPELHTVPLPLALSSDIGPAMTARGEGIDPKIPPEVVPDAAATQDYVGVLDRKDLAEKATAGLLEHEAATGSLGQRDDQNDPESRHDSAQEKVPQLSSEQKQELFARQSPALTLQTTQVLPRRDARADTITTSPTLSKHIITTADSVTTLPAFHSFSPVRERSGSSPSGEKLPSLQQALGCQLRNLDELAEVATQQDTRATSRQHSQSFGSASASASATSPFPPYPYLQPTSPYYIRGPMRSPTSTTSDQMYNSPTPFSAAAYYNDRRSSAPIDHPPHLPPSLPSASSSGDSHGATSSSIDGYSTAQTTPNEASDSTPRPILPPPHGMPGAVLIGTGFRCDYPGCNSVPFQTQYLLSSHKTVHSQVRNHYCPVEGCPRGEGGRGFKRKNEMIRHGLVHDSPGYVCPFCPEKEHRYPRPDNLQRHVRVHHVDKDKDDPLLREVLAQRREGVGKTRRRRAGTGASV